MYSEKLHANGQMVQQGERNLLETFLCLGRPDSGIEIPIDLDDLDGLNYLPDGGLDLGAVNDLAVAGPAYAHWQGGVPNMTLTVPARTAHALGQLYYLLERSVAVSGTLLGHNPFIQPGVVDYKRAIFALAGRPGHDQERQKMEQQMAGRRRVVVA
jgi:glucose-6-phosphate isomerase